MRTSPDSPDEPVPSPRAAAIRRKAIAARRAGEKVCACGEDRPEALIQYTAPAICMECDRKQRGVSTEDDHHFAGKANSPVTISELANDHAELNEMQRAWPERTLRNPEGSPLLAHAAEIRGLVDVNVFLYRRSQIPAAEDLESIDERLTRKLGPRWWERI